MNKAAKISLLIVLGLPLIVLLAVIGFFLVKDANDFKPVIEEQAKNAAGINLSIQGDLSWSLIPLGLDIHQISIKDQKLEDFASAERILASIDFWSLFEGSPKVETILLDGLNLNLIQNSDTENNWSNILPPKTSAESHTNTPATSPAVPAQTPAGETNKTSEASLNFLVESFQLINTRVHFESKPSGVSVLLNPLNLTLSNITFEQAFPISLDFALTEKKNQLDIRSDLKAMLTMSKDLTRFKIEQLDNRIQLKAPEFLADELRVQLSAELDADTKAETIDIPTLMLALNELKINAQTHVESYTGELKLQSTVDIPAFALKSLLRELKVTLPEMQAKDALEKVALSSTISLEKQTLKLDNLKLQLDQSNWKGTISRVLAEQPAMQATRIKLQGDRLNLDRYLPPASDAATAAAPPPPTPATAQESGLLPLETLRDLNLDIALQQDSLLIKGIETSNIALSVTAKDGKINQSLQGKLFEGGYNLTSRIDAQSSVPRWSSEQSISKLNLAPLMKILDIKELKEYGSIAGVLNFQGSLNASGNQIEALQTSAKGNFDFNIEQGAFEGISLNTYTCQGLALINRETIDTSSWPNATSFNTLKGSANIENQQISTRFDIITAGVHADSQGQVNLSTSELNIKAALKVIGESLDKACRVNEKLKDVGIPLVCKGKFDTPPAKLCKLDTSRLGDMAKDLAVEEGKRKLNKEVDRALEKHLGGEDKAPVKSLLKKLIK